jgi:hypothetical protein
MLYKRLLCHEIFFTFFFMSLVFFRHSLEYERTISSPLLV